MRVSHDLPGGSRYLRGMSDETGTPNAPGDVRGGTGVPPRTVSARKAAFFVAYNVAGFAVAAAGFGLALATGSGVFTALSVLSMVAWAGTAGSRLAVLEKARKANADGARPAPPAAAPPPSSPAPPARPGPASG
ncbi:hypothetical protein Afil01_44330 [Actinorhabdospora filicis]|uniref:Uncharacterized protein n=1 Tax=Actinorhabdospora filicis TaxID=1785913 RepID=A0A9W6WBJ3_9ACTN|nr:hypothetical protein Afil01_44330 [Actinorhabdospora filicis]